MNFFAHQQRARTRTFWLIVLFALAVLGIVLGVHGVVALLTEGDSLWNPGAFAAAAIGVCGLVGVGSGVRMASLAAGGVPVAESLGGRPVNPATRDPMERRLLNVVEEMAIASGTPTPQVYVLDKEESINAFAAGHKPSNAVIGVTRGTMNLLSRDELQGVVAHEFSHLLNGDTRLNMRLIGLLFGITLIALTGRLLFSATRYVRVSSSGSSESKGGAAGAIAAILLAGVGIYLVGSIGVFFASMIRSAVSRQREFLADASAVQFTRNAGGIAGALKKIGALALGSRVGSPSVSEASHMFFANGMERAFMQMFATHPPLARRIAAIEPSFNGDFTTVARNLEDAGRSPEAMMREDNRTRGAAPDRPLGDFGRTITAGAMGLSGEMPRAGVPQSPEAVPEAAGEVTAPHMIYASGAHTSFPPDLTAAAHELFGACAAVMALILSKDSTVRTEQLERLAHRMGEPMAQEAARLHAVAMRMPVELRLPLVDTLMPALAGLSRTQAGEFLESLQEMVEHDGEIDLFEFCLQYIVAHRLGRGRVSQRSIRRMDAVLPQAVVLLSALAALDAEHDPGAAVAFQAGYGALGTSRKARLLPADLRTLGHVEDALDRLALAAPEVQGRILLACARTVFQNNHVSVAEAELLRAIAESLDCPMPPFLAEPNATNGENPSTGNW